MDDTHGGRLAGPPNWLPPVWLAATPREQNVHNLLRGVPVAEDAARRLKLAHLNRFALVNVIEIEGPIATIDQHKRGRTMQDAAVNEGLPVGKQNQSAHLSHNHGA